MDKSEQEEAILQKIADTKDDEALYDEADETVCNEEGDFHSVLDGIYAGIGEKSKKEVWSVQIRDGIFWEVTGVVPKKSSIDREKIAEELKKIVPWQFKHCTIKECLKNQFKQGFYTVVRGLSKPEAEQIETLFKTYGLDQVKLDEENDFSTASFGFYIGTSFEKVKKRLESLPDKKASDDD